MRRPRPTARDVTPVAFVSPGFFDLVQAKALSGRVIGPGDTPVAPRVVVVNESFVRRFSPMQSPHRPPRVSSVSATSRSSASSPI